MDGGAFGVDRRWYCVKAQPTKEKLAALHLGRQGFRAFLPTMARVVRWPTRTETIQVPFFHGYLFVKLSLERDRWRSVNGTIGVSRLVQFGERPAPAPHGLIEGLIDLASEKGEIRFNDEFEPGDPVVVIGGPFNGLAGVFKGVTDEERVSILIKILSREVPVNVAKASVMAV